MYQCRSVCIRTKVVLRVASHLGGFGGQLPGWDQPSFAYKYKPHPLNRGQIISRNPKVPQGLTQRNRVLGVGVRGIMP